MVRKVSSYPVRTDNSEPIAAGTHEISFMYVLLSIEEKV